MEPATRDRTRQVAAAAGRQAKRQHVAALLAEYQASPNDRPSSLPPSTCDLSIACGLPTNSAEFASTLAGYETDLRPAGSRIGLSHDNAYKRAHRKAQPMLITRRQHTSAQGKAPRRSKAFAHL
ncbi:hypothetical protein ON010_g18714 [Phytophthora cinnamomi]|nr:hypothetical protein ON010_g18714 [Phytophthora cinnamomi]